jgi:ssDNA-binding replication factor A large subunit
LKLSDIEPNTNVPEIVLRVLKTQPPRVIKKRAGGSTMLKEVLVTDGDTSVVLSLWGWNEGEDISAGVVIRLTDGWAKEWQGKIQLSLGRSGKYEVIPDDGSIATISEIGARTDSEII